MVYEFDGTKYEKLRDMRAARRAKYLDLVRGGMNFTQAAHAVGVSKRTGKVWRNGRTRSAGRNGRPLVDRCRGGMDKPKQIDARYLCMGERIAIAGMHRVRQTAAHRPRCPSHECCVARWKADAMKSAQAGKRMSDRDIIVCLVERYERALVVRQRLDRNLSQLADTLGVKQPADTASADEHDGAAPASQQDDEASHHTDVSGQVIARQARRIIELEQTFAQLRGGMLQGKAHRRSVV